MYLGRRSRKALRRYLAGRTDRNGAMWVSCDGDRLSYGGLRGVISAEQNKQAYRFRPCMTFGAVSRWQCYGLGLICTRWPACWDILILTF